MSRIGKKPIQIPKNVQVSFDGNLLKAKGPKGELKIESENGNSTDVYIKFFL